MNAIKEYNFKPKPILTERIIMLLLISIIGYGIFKLAFHPLALFILLVPAYLLYLQFFSTKIISQYNEYDKGKKVTISADRLLLTLTQSDTTTIINCEEVEKVEIYKSVDLGRFGSYGYIIIYTNDQRKILITDLTIPLLVNDKGLEYFLRKKKRLYFKKRFNYIDVDKISLMR